MNYNTTPIAYTLVRKNGSIAQSGTTLELPNHEDGEIILELAPSMDHYRENGKWVKIPECPSIHYRFDYEAVPKRWILDEEFFVGSVLSKRSFLLSASDWTQMPDVPEKTKGKWKEYRQALRDITDQQGYPMNVTWPIQPK